MTKKDIIDAYCRIRTIDQTIPDDVLDFMKTSAISKLEEMEMIQVNNAYKEAERELGREILSNLKYE